MRDESQRNITAAAPSQQHHMVTTLHTEKSPDFSPDFLDEIAHHMSNKCTFTDPNKFP